MDKLNLHILSLSTVEVSGKENPHGFDRMRLPPYYIVLSEGFLVKERTTRRIVESADRFVRYVLRMIL